MIDKLREKISPEVKENEILAPYTTFKIGGPAKYFFVAKDSRDLLKAVKVAEELNLNYVIIGWGSNILVSDNGFDGLVIKAANGNYEIRGEEIYAESGISLAKLVGIATQEGLTGLESFTGIPSSFGGAVRGNAGAFGKSMADIIIEVEVYKDGKIKKYSNQDMKFSYRDSVIKHESGVVLSAIIKLAKGDPKEIKDKVVEISLERKGGHPKDPSAGCIFKNCELDKAQIDEERVIKELDISKEEWEEATKHGKLPIGFIIDHLGLKGKKIGGAQIAEQHGSFILNVEDAKAEHVIMMISDIKMRVRNQLGIGLAEEVQYIGF